MNKAPQKSQTGAQSVRRTIAIIKAVSKFDRTGARLTRIAKEVELPPPTVHRIMGVLLEEGFITFDTVTKLYHMGSAFYTMGEDTRQHAIRDRYQMAVGRITEQTGDASYLVMRSGYDGVCIERTLGTSRVQVLGYDIGERRPLGIGAAAQALLAFLPRPERELILTANAPRYRTYYNIDVESVRVWLKKCREAGGSYSQHKITPDAIGVGAPITDKSGYVVAAISTAGIVARMTPERCRQNYEIIKAEISVIDPPD